MSITIEQVEVWKVFCGIGHVVTNQKYGCNSTACGASDPGVVTTNRPMRICKFCRQALPKLGVVPRKDSNGKK